MEINYFNLAGGVNQSLTKTDLGLDTKTLYWTDSKNVEIYENRGIIKQKGNTLLFSLPDAEAVNCLCETEANGVFKLFITTVSGKIYVYSSNSKQLLLINKTLTGNNVKMASFMRGVVVATESDAMFYIKNNENYDIENCNLTDDNAQNIYPDGIAIYKGRLWCYKGSTIYYSALGTYNDFSTPDDAGYINDFHTDTADIVGMKNYKDYLAIYKKDRVYLLSGATPDDFAIIPFADKGAVSPKAIVNVDNKQYFLSINGIYALEQVGELNQIRLGSEVSQNIKNEIDLIDKISINNSIAIHYQNKHQMWYLFPYTNDNYFHTIWIYDYVNHAWFKRVVPQDVTCITVFNSSVISSDKDGCFYQENYGTTFNGSAIDFMWKSPFLSFNNPHHRKMIDEFYFVLDDNTDNKFNFSVYKDYDGNYSDDRELIYCRRFNQLVWAKDNMLDESGSFWPDEQDVPVWSIGTDTIEKAEICDSCYCVMLCVEGTELDDNCAIIGLQFREIYNDD